MDVRTQLLDAAVKVFAEAGFRGATTRRIAQEAGVNEVTLFRQFGSKEGLILEAVVQAVAQLQDRSALPRDPVDPAAELLDWAQQHYDFVIRHVRLIKAAMAESQAHPGMACVGERMCRSIDGTLGDYLARLRDAGLCAPDLDPAVAARVLSGAVFADALGREAHAHAFAFPATDAPARYVAFFLRAIGVRPAERPVHLRRVASGHHA